MGALILQKFSGMWPIADERMLPDNAAFEAVNVRNDAGGVLKGLGTPRLLKTLASTTKSVYRLSTSGNPTDIDGPSYWMEFTDRDTDVIRGPTINDSFERYYWCSPTLGLKYAPKANIISNGTQYDVGVNPTTGLLTLSTVAGTGALDPETGKNTAPTVTRAYVVTYINAFGEESQPSPPVEASGAQDADWWVRDIPATPSQVGRAAVTKLRLYRTITAESGSTTFFKVVDLTVGTTDYIDRLSDSLVSGQVQITSILNALPPTGLQGLAAMPNGIMVGFKDNNLYFSENYKPYSWPAEYTITVEHPIVGLGVFGNTCVVCTTGRPATVTGSKSASMSLSTNSVSLPCVSRRSIVATEQGVVYASDNGLVLFGPAGIQVITDEFIGREKWIANYFPKNILATYVKGNYMAAFDNAAAGFAYVPSNPQLGLSLLTLSGTPKSVGVDIYSGRPWVIIGTSLYEWTPVGATPLSLRWRSKEFQGDRLNNFSAAQLFFDPPAGAASGAEVIRLRIWVTQRGKTTVAERLVFDQPFTKDDPGRIIRLPIGFKGDIWQVEFEGTSTLKKFVMASTISELRNV